jgi:hypothetical protein
MGMVQSFYRASDAQIEALSSSPDKYAAMDAFLDLAEKVAGAMGGSYIDRAWDGIQFLLSGHSSTNEEMLSFLDGGAPGMVDIGNVGYGFAHAYKARETAEIADALREITPWVLHMRYDPARMAGLYPGRSFWITDEVGPWGGVDVRAQQERDQMSRSYLIQHYKQLKRFIRRAAADGLGFVTYRG